MIVSQRAALTQLLVHLASPTALCPLATIAPKMLFPAVVRPFLLPCDTLVVG